MIWDGVFSDLVTECDNNRGDNDLNDDFGSCFTRGDNFGGCDPGDDLLCGGCSDLRSCGTPDLGALGDDGDDDRGYPRDDDRGYPRLIARSDNAEGDSGMNGLV